MNRKILALMLVIIVFISGCSNNVTPPAELPIIRVSWIAWNGDYPIVVMKELGLDVKHGFRVEPVFAPDILTHRNNWETNKVEATFLNIEDVVKSAANGSNLIKVIFLSDLAMGDTVIASPDIKSVADLKGKRVGVIMGSTYGELMARRMLEANGLNINDVEFVNVDGSDVPGAIPKLIDAGATWEPHLSKAKAAGMNVIYSGTTDKGLPLSDIMAIQPEFAKTNPDAVKGFVAAWFEAVAAWQADPAKYSPAIAKIVGASPENIAKDQARFVTLEENIERFENGAILKDAQITTEFFLSTGQLNRTPKIEEILDDSFIKSVKGN
jgi:NitT/TauT family transport system substrate-binding protein